ncbi:unnamed protein product [Peronospora destructor]|uniref:Kinesin motor domain-containing protein n=1 Tax=Peronospora destructor TaxID=86335 RepID=A0AAV0TCH6_9STRA|nr:unnamed protein product [Peronospora destructor]
MADETLGPAEAENIAVCIRIRPLNEREIRSNDTHALCCVPSLKMVSITDPVTGAPLSTKGNVFQYDEIFDTTSNAHSMYSRVGRRIVRSTLSGINGTIFAYGQTSSGKTFTMQGDGGMPFDVEATSRSGILQLAVEDIFHYIETCKDRDFLLRVSFLEIYNEGVKDLLSPTTSLKLREDPRKGVYVECKEEIITTYDDIVTLLQTGNRNRTVGQTAMNKKSSRSHSVFRIVIESKQKADSRRLSEEDVNGAVLVASLNLVDLAGSESLRHTGAEGIRQREAGNINKSLLTLARVINSLASAGGGGQNAPFRDSKLTRLLQNSLGGNTRTLIICCVTPSDKYIEETKSTLQFAARAKDIQTSATVNEVLDDQTQLRRLKRELHELKKLVNSEALSALKAENEALISEKNHNKTEIARLMGLILSSSSVTKANTVSKKRKRRKCMRETWGPGDFPADINALRTLSPGHYPRKRHSPTKENTDPQTLFRVYEDVKDNLAKEQNPAFSSATDKFKPKQADVDDSIKNVIDLFSAIFQSYNDENCEDPIAAVEAIVNEKKRTLLGGDFEHADVLTEIKSLMVTNLQSKSAINEKIVLEQTVKDLRLKLNEGGAERDCSKIASNANSFAEEVMTDLVSTQECLAKEKKRCHDLETEKANSQQMAAEELNALRCQLETLRIESTTLQQRYNREKHKLVATVETLQSRLPLHNKENEASSPENEKKLQEDASSTDETKNAVMDKLAQELQNIMQELALLQSDHEQTALEKEELQAETQRMTEEFEFSQHQLCVMSETLMEKEHIAKILQAQLDAKLVTISQMQAKHSDEVESLQQSILDLGTEKEQLLTKIQEVGAAENTATDETDATKSATECIDNANKYSWEANKTQKLRSALEKMTEQLSAVEPKLADAKAILRSMQHLPEQHQLMIAFNQLEVGFHNMQQASNSLLTDFVVKQEQIANVSSPDDPNTDSLDYSEQRYNTLKEDYERVTEELKNVLHERNNCMEELRALEAQLMQVSEEKMKCAITADKQEFTLREAQQVVLSSSETIKMLQAQLEDTRSSKAILEASKAELEQNITNLQMAWTSLQADHAATVEQMEDGKREFKPENESSATEAEHLQQRVEIESQQRKKLQLDVQSYEETLSVLRKEAKNNSDTIADLSENIRILKTHLDLAACTQQKSDKELVILRNALTMSEEEQQEMRLQSKERLVAAEGKEMALQDRISALELQLKMSSTGMDMVSEPLQNDVELELVEARAKQTELQSKATALENQLSEARQELLRQDNEWKKKQGLTKTELARLTTEQTQLRDEVSTLKTGIGASQHAMEVQAEELLKAQESCAELLEQKKMVRRKLEAAEATWEAKQQDLMRQMDSIREQFQEAQTELEGHQKNANDEICRLRSVIEKSDAEIAKLKHRTEVKEEDWKIRISEQEKWQKQANSRQEMLQTECNELDIERRLLKDNCAAVEAQRREIEEQLRNKIHELQQKYAAAQAQQANYQGKLKEIEAQLEMTENEVTQNRREMKSLAESLKFAQTEAINNHNKHVETQLAKESMEKLVERQKTRIDKLDKVKMTTETLELFRKLKTARSDLQIKVHDLQKDLAQALSRSRGDQLEKEHCLVKRKEEELKFLTEQVEELRTAIHQARDDKATMRAALNDEREKAEHEIQEMQTLVKEKMELVENLESQLASVEDAMVKLREQKSENVSYLEKENLELHVENRELKKQLASTSLPKKDEVMGDTGTYDASAAAAVKVLGEDRFRFNEVDVVSDDCGATTRTSSRPQEAGATKAGGFLFSTTEMDAIATYSQDEPKEVEQPECSQQ